LASLFEEDTNVIFVGFDFDCSGQDRARKLDYIRGRFKE